MSDIRDSIVFLGNRSDVARLYQAMDVFVLPSRYEGLPVVGVEAQAAGLPCVFSDAITKEAVLTENTKLLSVLQGTSIWKDSILKKQTDSRKPGEEDTPLHGFDIDNECIKLAEFYFKAVSGQ